MSSSSNRTSAEIDSILARTSAATLDQLIPTACFQMSLAFVGFVGNSVSLYIFVARMGRTFQNDLLIFLTVMNLWACVLCMPLDVADVFYAYVYPSAAMCKVSRWSNTTSTGAQALTLIVLAVVRYRVVCKGKPPQVKVSYVILGLVLTIASVSWIASIVFGYRSVPLIHYPDVIGQDCSVGDDVTGTLWPLVFYTLLGTVFSALVVVTAFCYIRIWKTVKSSRIKVAQHSLRGETVAKSEPKSEEMPKMKANIFLISASKDSHAKCDSATRENPAKSDADVILCEPTNGESNRHIDLTPTPKDNGNIIRVEMAADKRDGNTSSDWGNGTFDEMANKGIDNSTNRPISSYRPVSTMSGNIPCEIPPSSIQSEPNSNKCTLNKNRSVPSRNQSTPSGNLSTVSDNIIMHFDSVSVSEQDSKQISVSTIVTSNATCSKRDTSVNSRPVDTVNKSSSEIAGFSQPKGHTSTHFLIHNTSTPAHTLTDLQEDSLKIVNEHCSQGDTTCDKNNSKSNTHTGNHQRNMESRPTLDQEHSLVRSITSEVNTNTQQLEDKCQDVSPSKVLVLPESLGTETSTDDPDLLVTKCTDQDKSYVDVNNATPSDIDIKPTQWAAKIPGPKHTLPEKNQLKVPKTSKNWAKLARKHSPSTFSSSKKYNEEISWSGSRSFLASDNTSDQQRRVRKRIRTMSSSASRKRKSAENAVSVTAFLLTLTFVVSYTPFFLVSIPRSVTKDADYVDDAALFNLINIAVRFYFVTPAINPFIFLVSNLEFRRQLTNLLCSCFGSR